MYSRILFQMTFDAYTIELISENSTNHLNRFNHATTKQSDIIMDLYRQYNNK